MLSAQSTRELSLAARAASKYLKELGIELPHAKALDLVARLVGKPHHMAAQAARPSTGLPRPQRLSSWGDLRAALSALTPEQLAMSVTVSEGCDSNGNAEFFPGFELLCAGSDSLQAASDGVLEGEQPVLLFNGPFDEDLANVPARQGSVPYAVVEDLCRILAHPDVDRALYAEGVSDAAYAAMADATPFIRDELLKELPRDVLQAAYDNLPVTVTPQEFQQGHGNWGLHEGEMALAVRLARLLAAPSQPKELPLNVCRLMAQFELALGQSPVVVDQRTQELGVLKGMRQLNEEFGLGLSLGDWLVASDEKRGYWNNSFGWTASALAASGFEAATDRTPEGLSNLPTDARWVRFSQAKDFE